MPRPRPRPRLTMQQKSIRRLNYVCPKCGSDLLTNNERMCRRSYQCGKKDCSGCTDYGSNSQNVMKLKCLKCGYEFSIVFRL